LRVVQTIKHWIEKHGHDFDQEELNVKLDEFMEIMKKTGGSKYIQTILSSKDKLKMSSLVQHKRVENIPTPLEPLKDSSLFDWDPKEISRQIALLEFKMLRNIEPRECYNQNWVKKDKEILAPNIVTFCNWFNKLSSYLVSSIVFEENLKERARKLQVLIQSANESKLILNFNAVFSIVSAISTSAVFRLKKTWEEIPKKYHKMYSELDKFVSIEGNYKLLRSSLSKTDSCIPYIGMYLTGKQENNSL
jgi:son of sevenless